MGDRYFKNSFEDYERGDLSVLNEARNDLSDQFKAKLKEKTETILKTLHEKRKYWYDRDDFSLYTGVPGVAYTLYHYGKVFNQPDFISKAIELVDEFIDSRLKKSKREITFLCGVAGVLSLAAVMHHNHGDKERSEILTSDLHALGSFVIDPANDVIPDELLYGRSGYLYCLLFVNQHITPAPIDDSLIKSVINQIIRSGKAYSLATKCQSPIMYAWHESEYLGGAHGLGGILYLLLQARRYLTNDQLKNEIEPALRWLSDLRYSSGNFPSSVGSKSDRLVHWCHGAPSMSMLFSLAHKIFQSEKYLKIALDCGDVIWQRGLLKKGCGLCHGTAGNAYTFLNLFQTTNDYKHLYRACKFAEWCFDYDSHQTRLPDRPFSLFEGLAGTIYFLVDLQKPTDAKFPGYTL